MKTTEDAPVPEPDVITQPRLGVTGTARFIWRQLTSMRTALWLLLLLAVAAVPGSIWPQRGVDPGRVDQYFVDHPKLAPIVDSVGGFSVYSSVWFSAIYLLLMISLVGCVIPRTREHIRDISRPPGRTPRNLNRMPAHVSATIPGASDQAAVDQAVAAARQVLRQRRYRVAGPEQAGENSLSAERGYSSETGNLLFHFSLLGLLIAAAVKATFSFTGQSIVVEGSSFVNSVARYDSFLAGARVNTDELQPFSIKLLDFQSRFEESTTGNQFGAPRDFRGTVEIRDTPDAAPRREELRVNHPISMRTSTVFLVGNGYAVDVTVQDAQGNTVVDGPVVLRVLDGMYTSSGAIKAPDALPKDLGFSAMLLPTAAEQEGASRPISIFPGARNPRLVLRGYVGDLGMDSGAPQSVYLLDTRKMTEIQVDGKPWQGTLAIGQSVELPDGGKVTFNGVKPYVALDIASDPSNRVALLSSMAALLGVLISLYVRRRRVWVQFAPAAAGIDVHVAGLARREDATLLQELETVLGKLVPAENSPRRNDTH